MFEYAESPIQQMTESSIPRSRLKPSAYFARARTELSPGIGSFFVDSDDDIGYKYLVSGGQTMTQAAFESAYFTMAAVARERRPEIRKLLGSANEKEDKPSDVKKAAEEKPPSES